MPELKPDQKCLKCGAVIPSAKPDAVLARALHDTIGCAKEIHAKALLGQLHDPRLAETQRKAALDVLSGDWLRNLTDEALLAEVERRFPESKTGKKP